MDENGEIHRNGRMRLATAVDEIESIEHPKVQEKESYLPVLLLGRVVTQLGTLPTVGPRIVAQLYASDFIYLQDLYLRLNSTETITLSTMCPQCNHAFQLQVAPLDN